MIIRKDQCRVVYPEGTSRIQRHFLEENQSFGAGRVFCIITVPEHAGDGKYHQHIGEFEIWHIIQGSAIVCEDRTECMLEAGDTEICMPGSSHSIRNAGNGDLVFAAIVLYERTTKYEQNEEV